MRRLMKMNPRDNVGVALQPITAGEELQLNEESVRAAQDIPQGHKIALTAIPAGSSVTKYGYSIGHVVTAIAPGEWVHTHNIRTNLAGEEQYVYQPNLHPVIYPKRSFTFQGYRRANGKTGIRNDLYIVPTVGCVNGIAEQMIRAF